jgi:hypothetical protein
MEILQGVAPEQQRFRQVRLFGFQSESALFREIVIARVKTFARLRDEQPTQALQRLRRVFAGAGLILEVPNLYVQFTRAFVCGQGERRGISQASPLLNRGPGGFDLPRASGGEKHRDN